MSRPSVAQKPSLAHERGCHSQTSRPAALQGPLVDAGDGRCHQAVECGEDLVTQFPGQRNGEGVVVPLGPVESFLVVRSRAQQGIADRLLAALGRAVRGAGDPRVGGRCSRLQGAVIDPLAEVGVVVLGEDGGVSAAGLKSGGKNVISVSLEFY